MIWLDFARLGAAATAADAPQRATAAQRHGKADAIVGPWARAGLRAGLYLGAAFGTAVTLVAGIGSFLALGAIVGGTIGALAGLALGSAIGVVLACLAAMSLLGTPPATSRAPQLPRPCSQPAPPDSPYN